MLEWWLSGNSCSSMTLEGPHILPYSSNFHCHSTQNTLIFWFLLDPWTPQDCYDFSVFGDLSNTFFCSASNCQFNTISVKRSILYFWNLSKSVEMCLIAQSMLWLCKHIHCTYLEGNGCGEYLTDVIMSAWSRVSHGFSLLYCSLFPHSANY